MSYKLFPFHHFYRPLRIAFRILLQRILSFFNMIEQAAHSSKSSHRTWRKHVLYMIKIFQSLSDEKWPLYCKGNILYTIVHITCILHRCLYRAPPYYIALHHLSLFFSLETTPSSPPPPTSPPYLTLPTIPLLLQSPPIPTFPIKKAGNNYLSIVKVGKKREKNHRTDVKLQSAPVSKKNSNGRYLCRRKNKKCVY